MPRYLFWEGSERPAFGALSTVERFGPNTISLTFQKTDPVPVVVGVLDILGALAGDFASLAKAGFNLDILSPLHTLGKKAPRVRMLTVFHNPV